MPLNPIDDHLPNPFVLEESRLLKAAMELARAKKANAVKATAPAAAPGAVTPKAAPKQFELSTSRIITLITRYKIDRMTHKELDNLPFSQLDRAERDFIQYLRRNPDMFARLAQLDKRPGNISAKDIKIAAQLAGDALVLSDEDMKYLKEVPVARADRPYEQDTPVSRLAARLTTDNLIRTVAQLAPPEQGLTYPALMAMPPGSWPHLDEIGRQSVEFLRSEAVSKVLEKVTEPYHGLITPDALRILTSLIWNPAIYGATPIVFHHGTPLHPDIEPVTATHIAESTNPDNRYVAEDHFCPSRRIEAHHIMDICHKINPRDGHVSLKQLQHYHPENEEEEKALNLLRQAQIFKMLAGLDNDPGSLSDDDIRLALAEGTIILSDPHIVLIILP